MQGLGWLIESVEFAQHHVDLLLLFRSFGVLFRLL